VTPFTADRVHTDERSSVDDHPTTRACAQNDTEDHAGTFSTTIKCLGQRKTIGIVIEAQWTV
tara:strand:- start:338 stop:523 length:186 start_codon:yes stop_codon:yes gene_type:complete